MVKAENMQISIMLGEVYERVPFKQKAALARHILDYARQLDAAKEKGATPAELAGHVAGQIDEQLKTFVEWHKISCKPGCSHCCKINVTITEGEADLIVDYCRVNKIKINKPRLEIQRNLTDKQRFKSKERDCIFLGENGLCKVYEVRPIICRKYMVQTPAALCKVESGSVGVNFEVNAEVIISGYYTAVQHSGHMSDMILKSMKRLFGS